MNTTSLTQLPLTASLYTYIISLKKPIDKIKYLRKFGLQPKWYKGVNGETINEQIVSEYISKFYRTFGPKSAIGCAISHVKLWELAIARGNKQKYTLILEDDVVLNPDFNMYIEDCLKNVPEDFDILYLGGFGAYSMSFMNCMISLLSCKLPKPAVTVNNLIKKPSVLTATHAYIISQKGAKKLVNFIKGHINNHIDVCINTLYQKGVLDIYMAFPELASQTSSCNISKSENIKSDFPIIINWPASKLLIDPYVTADYALNISILRLGPFNINPISILFLIMGVILSKWSNINLSGLTIFFIGILIPELLYNPLFSDKKITQIVFNYLLLISYKLLKTAKSLIAW